MIHAISSNPSDFSVSDVAELGTQVNSACYPHKWRVVILVRISIELRRPFVYCLHAVRIVDIQGVCYEESDSFHRRGLVILGLILY